MLNRISFIKAARLFLKSALVIIALLIISGALEVLLIIFVDIFVLPRGYFKWSTLLEVKLYIIYLVVFIAQLLISYKALKKYKQSKRLCFIILYFLWLSLPTYTHWVIDGGADYGGHPDPPIGIVVPNILALERAFIFVSPDSHSSVMRAISNDFFYINTGAVLYIILIAIFRKRKSNTLCKENILERGAVISGFIVWFSIIVTLSFIFG